MDNSLRNTGSSPDVSLRTKVLFASALASLGLLLANESVKDKTGSNGFNLFGGTAGLVDRAAAEKNAQLQKPSIPKGMENMAGFGESGY